MEEKKMNSDIQTQPVELRKDKTLWSFKWKKKLGKLQPGSLDSEFKKGTALFAVIS